MSLLEVVICIPFSLPGIIIALVIKDFVLDWWRERKTSKAAKLEMA